MSRDVCRAHPAWTVVGVDLDGDVLRTARAWTGDEHLRAAFYRADLTRSVGTGLYDVVLAMECLAEIPDDTAALTRLAEALRPGGLLVAHVLHANWQPVLRSSRQDWEREVRRGYDRDSFLGMLDAAGFEVERVAETTRGLAQLAGDIGQRFESTPPVAKAPLLPVMMAAVGLDRAGVTWGPSRGLFVEATRR